MVSEYLMLFHVQTVCFYEKLFIEIFHSVKYVLHRVIGYVCCPSWSDINVHWTIINNTDIRVRDFSSFLRYRRWEQKSDRICEKNSIPSEFLPVKWSVKFHSITMENSHKTQCFPPDHLSWLHVIRSVLCKIFEVSSFVLY